MAIPVITEATLLDLSRRQFHFQSGWRMPIVVGRGALHQHAGWEMVYHAAGQGSSSTPTGERMTFHKGSVLIYPPEFQHVQTTDVAGEDVCVVFEIEGRVPRALQHGLAVHGIADKHLLSEIAALARPREQMTRVQRIIWECRIAAVFLSVLDLARQKPMAAVSADRARLYADAAYRIIQEDYRTLAALTDVAPRVGVSADYLRHAFKKSYGIGLKDFLVQTRIKRAEDLLLYSVLPVKTIAALCGFAADGYFCTVFRRTNKCPPAVFRSRNQALLRNRRWLTG